MKYKLKPENRDRHNKNSVNRWLFLDETTSATPTVKPIPTIVANTNEYGICFLVIILPSLLAKVSFLINFVLVAKVTIKGITTKVLQKINDDKADIPKVFLTNALTVNPPDIPSQNTKFHILSLLSHFSELVLAWVTGLLFIATGFVKSCISFFYSCVNSYSYIIPKIYSITKQLLLLPCAFLLLLLASTANASNDDKIVRLISAAEAEHNIPSGLLTAIAKTESDLKEYALNIQGKPVYFADRSAALRTIKQALDSGITNIDIGVMQINYKWHYRNFSSIDSMLSLRTNIYYAAGLLSRLKKEHGDWHKAIRHYHSANLTHSKKYSRKVVLAWVSG